MAPKDYIFNPERNPLIRNDYRPSEYRIPAASLHISLDETDTTVKNRFTVERNPASAAQGGPLILNGEDLKLKSIQILENGNWRELDRQEFTVDNEHLIIKRPPAGTFELKIENDINPTTNTKLSGIYTSGGGIISSQNEAQGFRRITYFLDRPDNLTVFDATIEADKAKFPVLLANGNGDYKATTDLGNGRHSIHWTDPWPKPSYLFAMVAGDLKVLEDKFTTMSGKEVDVRIFVQPGYEDKVQWAMEATKRAMRWDEVRYGREYDLDCFHIVAVDKFNAGAMENKGLNIFNVARLVGNPETSTDGDLMDIEEVIGHEYFHNWTGDRVTVRDWFEISLKESLTSLRQRQFACDMHSAAVKLIDDATILRTGQFIEDSGPSAHCVRPDRVEEFDNIYSTTVYQKGKHVLNMMNTILGDAMWRTAMDNYFTKFDGRAVTVDDFIDNMQDTSGIDLKQFRRWYSQSGTPEVSYEGKYDAAAKTYTLTLSQHTPATADQPASEKKPLHIPVSVGLIGQSGKDVALTMEGDTTCQTTYVLNLTQDKQTFVFKDVPGPVVPSILRNFSAPVKITTQPSDDELIFRMAHDSDPFNKFEAKERLMLKTLLGLIDDVQQGKPLKLPQAIVDAFGQNLAGAIGGDSAFAAQMLSMPAYNIVIQNLKTVDPDAIKTATKFMSTTLAETFREEFMEVYKDTLAPAGEKYDVVPAQVGRRSLHNMTLSYLGKLEEPGISAMAQAQYGMSKNMTEKLGSLSTLARMEGDAGPKLLESFYQSYKTNNNLVDRWLTLKAATASGADAAGDVRKLLEHEAFDMENPNKVRALMGGFTAGNPTAFHAKDGSGYKLLADVVIEMNAINPRVAAQIVRPLTQFKRYDAKRQELMLSELQRVMETPNLDKGLKEVVGQTLATAEKKPQSAAFGKAAPRDEGHGHSH
ncbi:MAG: aminopeptidase N [Alphaproteobacteria bacterium]|nr:MAG: aminopeptidase N [Alphaproteobacteria bacterium]